MQIRNSSLVGKSQKKARDFFGGGGGFLACLVGFLMWNNRHWETFKFARILIAEYHLH